MKIHAILTTYLPASDKAHKARDLSLISKEKAFIDLWDIKEVVKDLEEKADKGQSIVVALAKKAGLKPIGRPDLHYGTNGCEIGPIEHWYQIVATD